MPNKGQMTDPAARMLEEAGYRQRHEKQDLTVLDPDNDIEFFFLRPKDIPLYVGSGELDLGITGRDFVLESGAPLAERLRLGFAECTFRYAAPAEHGWTVDDLDGKRIATSRPNLTSTDLARRGLKAEVVRLDGAVEISVQLGVADAIADIVSSGHTLRRHGLAIVGDPICTGEAVLVDRADADAEPAKEQFLARIRGVVVAQQYVMLEYVCRREELDAAAELTPGLESPTILALADDRWISVRAMVCRKNVPTIMDRLAAAGAKAIVSSDVRACRL
ncbi:ATP phosphoribosyltransferase [Saccharopolyspora erythraea]|uniref:ATP phosphoribosyltransferase n=1 Tax=Saccharopolyspora erythraea TaxID=1836 RepID=UPI001BA7BA02|nr:ATP phosphoribosyltransferase [Saccharopolyspora erythraea]QUH06287.1 ATP phosphoribosyltransferase [Saccharopolyspora erythraea]